MGFFDLLQVMFQAIAMNLLHGDHVNAEKNLLIVILGSHETGSPCTILANGWACSLYSFRTIDV